MGVSHLQAFAKRTVPNGTFSINIRDEIRNYFNNAKLRNPPPPIIVVDLMCLVHLFCELDTPGVLCGGRFNGTARIMNQFFGELRSLGAELHFFNDGPVRCLNPENWFFKKETDYWNMIKLFDAVDLGDELLTMANSEKLPFHYVSTLKQVAINHGGYHWATANECDQEMVVFANKSNALAIVSNDSDFLIYEGSWRLWCTSELDIKNLTTIEYDRAGIVNYFGLRRSQMPLLATLAGNDVVDPDSLRRFHHTLGSFSNKLPNVAEFIRSTQNQSEDRTLIRVLEHCTNRRELMTRFKESLNLYKAEFKPFNVKHLNEPIEAILLSRNISLFYQMWHSRYIECPPGIIDMRQELGEQILSLKLSLILRMGGIILYQRQMQRRMVDYSKSHLMMKLNHESAPALHHYSVEFPINIKPPPLEELMSNDPVTCDDLHDIKEQLFCWVVSDSLNHRRLGAIPKELQTTVLTLYCMVERQIIKPFEADLLLQVANDVTFSTYDPQTISYPRKLDSRPFRVAFAYQHVYGYVAKAFNLVGLTTEINEDPPFDGVLFHNWYDYWSRQLVASSLDKDWRLHESIAAPTTNDDLVV